MSFGWMTMFALGLLVATCAAFEFGRFWGNRFKFPEYEGAHEDVRNIVFALFGLMVAFTFAGAMSRFDGRRDLIVDEANKIGTAWLRIDLAAPNTQPQLRKLFRDYVDARLKLYAHFHEDAIANEEQHVIGMIQQQIWTLTVAGTNSDAHAAASNLLIPAVNDMIDVTTTRAMAVRKHPPAIIYGMLICLAMATAGLVGHSSAGTRRRSSLALGFLVVMTAVLYITIDLEQPRSGLFRINDFDSVLVELRKSMN